MAITNQLPVSGSFIDPDTTVGFDIDDTYTTMRIEVTTLLGVEYAWDSSLGGQQTGYSLSTTDNGDGTESWTVLRDAGWDQDPQTVTVFENESGADVETALSWLLSGSVQYPQDDNPYYSELGAGFKVTEDNVGIVVNVTHLDFVAGAEDGITVTDLGGGKVRLTARATTNDPNAIHTNVASEIFAITEKTGVNSGDLAIIEDSAAGYVKKKAQRQYMGGARAPAKLEDDLDCVMLYTFDGVLTDDIAGGLELSTTVGTQQYGIGMVGEARGLFLDGQDGVKSSNLPLTKLDSGVWGGDFTTQIVILPGKCVTEDGIVDCSMFWLREAATAQRLFELGYPSTGSGIQEPGCWFTDSTNTRHETDSGQLILGDGMPVHMLQRVYDAGAGLYTQEIWVNGLMTGQTTGHAAPWPYNPAKNYFVQVGKGAAGTGGGRCIVESCKLSSRKLTDAEILQEYRKALGYPAI